MGESGIRGGVIASPETTAWTASVEHPQGHGVSRESGPEKPWHSSASGPGSAAVVHRYLPATPSTTTLGPPTTSQ